MDPNRNTTGRLLFALLCIAAMFSVGSCRNSRTADAGKASAPPSADSILNYNREVVGAERTEIEDFIARYQWKMETTRTGLRYMIYKAGKGRNAAEGDRVEIRYCITLLNGNAVAETPADQTFSFELGRRKVVSGLEEGILLMQAGGKARLIVPSHLAYGLLGDPAGIPSGAVLVYDVELCAVTARE